MTYVLIMASNNNSKEAYITYNGNTHVKAGQSVYDKLNKTKFTNVNTMFDDYHIFRADVRKLED